MTWPRNSNIRQITVADPYVQIRGGGSRADLEIRGWGGWRGGSFGDPSVDKMVTNNVKIG